MKFWYCTYLEFLTYLTCPCGFIEVKRQSSYHGSQKIKKWISRAKYFYDFNIQKNCFPIKLGNVILTYQFYLKRNRIVSHLAWNTQRRIPITFTSCSIGCCYMIDHPQIYHPETHIHIWSDKRWRFCMPTRPI